MDTDNKFKEHWNTADPYTYSELKDKRKEMRDHMTLAESVLWNHIKSKKLGVKFRRQHVIGNFIPDFVALSCKLVIEVDGEIHNFQKEADEQRTFVLNEKGYKVIRFTNNEILLNINQVLDRIKNELTPDTKMEVISFSEE
ncbi:MAG TPA: endonuclease domain-containing protein [Paludibacter sp.]|nr:endonuclease domain-containing protein [Paludibacter sp.]